VNRLVAPVAGGVTGTTDRANWHGQRLHRLSKIRPTTRYKEQEIQPYENPSPAGRGAGVRAILNG
jgi:hypothetical protein